MGGLGLREAVRLVAAVVAVLAIFGGPAFVANATVVWILTGHGPLEVVYNLVTLEDASLAYRAGQVAGSAVFVAQIWWLRR